MKSKTNTSTRSVKTLAPIPQVRLRIHDLRVQHGYRSVTDLWKKLTSMGITISHSQLTRVANNLANMLDKELLGAFTVIFDCSIGDLFEP